MIFDDGYVFKHFYKDAADYGEDFPTLEQFKKECAAEGGEILMEGFDSFAYADTSARCTITFAEHNDCDEKTGRCERVAPPEDTLIVYKDPYWKKYIMALVDNCKLELEP